jgi:hypothetical protein
VSGALKIALEAVEGSTSIAALGYDAARSILAVQFLTGEIYHFAGVSTDTALALYGAESRGGYFHTSIRGRYWSERMTGPCPRCGASGWIGDLCTDCGCDRFQAVPKDDDTSETGRATGPGVDLPR